VTENDVTEVTEEVTEAPESAEAVEVKKANNPARRIKATKSVKLRPNRSI